MTKAAADKGTATQASRQDHKHDISTAVVGTISENATPAEGSDTSLARSDHVHGSPASWTPAAHTLDSHSEKKLDTLSEKTLNAGVTVDTCLIKDGKVADSNLLEGSNKATVQDHTPKAHTLNSHTAATGAVDFGKQEATTLVLHKATGAPAAPVDAQVYFENGDDHAYIYVAA